MTHWNSVASARIARFRYISFLAVVTVCLMTACGGQDRGGPVSLAPLGVAEPGAGGAEAPKPEQPLRIFWVSSYGEDDPWSRQIRTGTWEALARAGYSVAAGTLVWEAHSLDASPLITETTMTPRIDEARDAILAFRPDVVIVSDDEAVQGIVPLLEPYDFDVVACGLDGSPRTERSSEELLRSDITVIVEPIRPVQTVRMAREFTERSGAYLLIGDASLTGQLAVDAASEALSIAGLAEAMRQGTATTWDSWQELVLREGTDARFVIIAGYRPVLDEDGQLVSSQAMMAWMLEHVDVPVFSLVNSVVIDGAVGGLVADGYEQGRLAGEGAIAVHQGRGAFLRTGPSRLVVNAAAARHWGLQIPALFPIAAEVYRSLPVISPASTARPVAPSSMLQAAALDPLDSLRHGDSGASIWTAAGGGQP